MDNTSDQLFVWTRTILVLLSIHGFASCAEDSVCEYRESKDGKVADCSCRGFTDVPTNINRDTVILDLYNNKIQKLFNDSFEDLPLLKSLNLGTNKISVVALCSFCSLTNLQYLNISDNKPGGLKLIRNVTFGLQSTHSNVTKLDFTHMESEFDQGKMVYRDDLVYANKTKIKELNVSSNMFETIEKGSVYDFPPDLEVLDLSDNRPIFGEYMLEIKNLKKLKILHANKLNSYHPIDVFQKRSIARETPSYMHALENLKNTDIGCYDILPPKLEEVYCHNSMIPYDIPRIPVCPENSLRRIELFHNALSQWFGPLEGFNKLEHLDLSLNFCDNISDYFFSNVTSLKSLSVRANFIGYVISDRQKMIEEHHGGHPCPWLQPLKNLTALDLYLNKIRQLPRECLSSQRSLENLTLRENSLTDWELRIGHMPNISFIDLSGNSIDRFPKNAMDHLSKVSETRNVTIDLSGNDIECVCQNIDFLEWFAKVNIKFINKETYMCRDKEWNTLLNMSNVEEIIGRLKVECTNYTYLNTVLSVLLGCFILAVLYGIYHKYRWKLSYMYYTTWGRYNLVEDDKGQYCYDAYIAYSEDDNHFAENELASSLEDMYGLKLYLFDRDCKPGKSIFATIVDKLEKSRKTILLFNGSFIRNDRCRFELRMANEKKICRNAAPDSVFVIQLESVPKKEVPEEVFRLFQNDLYIEYPHDPQGNNIFWEKLKNTIKPQEENA